MCMCMYMCMWAHLQANMCHGVHVDIREQVSAIKCLLPSCLNRVSCVSATSYIQSMLVCEVLCDGLVSPPPNYHGNARMMDGYHHIHVLHGFERPRSSGFCRMHIYPISHFIASPRHDILETIFCLHSCTHDRWKMYTHRVCAHRKQVKYRVGLEEYKPRLLLCIICICIE